MLNSHPLDLIMSVVVGGGSPPTRAPPPPTLTGDGGRVKSAELRAFIRDTPGIGVASVTVATIAVMRNFHILLSASEQIAPLAVICGANVYPSFAPSVQNCSDRLYRPDVPCDQGEQWVTNGQTRRAPKHRALRKITENRNQSH